MEKTRLLQLLRTLSREELRGLKRFLDTPFFNRRPEAAALLRILEGALKTGNPAPAKPEAYAGVFGAGPFDDHRLRMAMSFLYQLTGQFLAVRDFLHDQPNYQLRLAGLLRRRQLPVHFRQAYAQAEAVQQARSWRNAAFFEESYQLLLEKYRFDLDTEPADRLDLQALSDRLDHAFLARKLWQACFMLSHQARSNTTYRFGLLEETLAYIEQAGAVETPAIGVYYYCYRMLTHPDERTYFREFKSRLLSHGEVFPPEERRDLYILAINFCIRQYNAGSPDYLQEQFDFYKEGLAGRYFLVDGVLSRYTYLNAATVGLVMHELEWVDQFIHAYRDFLKEPYRESLFSFNLARLEYQRRRLGPALQLLQKAEYKDVLLHLAAKTLQLKIFYELGEHDLLESHLQAIRTFIHRKKVMGYHRENYLNTVNFTRKLLEISPYEKEARLALRAEIEGTKAVAEKEWLLGKCLSV